ncbi:hypothetical protein BH11ACT3_BH11ACT3_21700 [soil metagenome]
MATRSGPETRTEALRIAVELFTTQGYEATSLRQIAERLDISKASLYYHFPSKADIVRAALGNRGDEAGQLLAWAQAQPATPDLLERTVLRWVDALSVDKLRGIRFANANPALMRAIADDDPGRGIRDGLEPLAALLAGPGADARRHLLIRMAFLSINAAAMAAAGSTATDSEIVDAARAMAASLVATLQL